MGEYELVVRKKISQFIEKEFRYFGYDFNHDEYKKIVYGEKGFTTPLEERLKSYYDACMYLLSNAKSPLTRQIINKFYYLVFGEPLNELTLLSIQTKLIELSELSPIEKACEFHMYVYERLDYLCLLERQIVSLMFMNYVLVKNDIPAIKLVGKEIEKYIAVRKKYFTAKEEMFFFIKKIIDNSFILKRTYLENLKPITVCDIYNSINQIKDFLISKYKLEALYLYGSFSKGINRYDSDIDLLVKLSLELTYDDRIKIIEDLKHLFFEKFQRFVDIEEVREFFNDEFIKEATKIKRII